MTPDRASEMAPDRMPDAVQDAMPDATEVQRAARAVGVSLEGDQAARLLAYLELLQRWNAVYNLTAVRAPAAMWRQHVLDCLVALPPLRRVLGPGRQRVLDVGSGGGLPGLVWAIADPLLDVTCVDAVGKKAAFIRDAAGRLGLRHASAAHARIERFEPAGGAFDVITSRAFASLVDFVGPTRRLLAPEGVWLAMKGKRPDDELAALAAAGSDADVFHVEQLEVPGLDAERCLIWLRPATPGRPPT